MNYVLDTNAVSALMKGAPAILQRLRQLDKQKVSIPEPVFAELAYGIERFGSIKAALERRGVRIEDFDAAIAAHAAAAGAVLVTANIEHMARISDLVVEDWAKTALPGG